MTSPSRKRAPLWRQAGRPLVCPRTLSYMLDTIRSPQSESGSNKTDKSVPDKMIFSIEHYY